MKKPLFYKIVCFISLVRLSSSCCSTHTRNFPQGSILGLNTQQMWEALASKDLPLEKLARDYDKTQKELQNFEKYEDSLRRIDKYPYDRVATLTAQRTILAEAIRDRE